MKKLSIVTLLAVTVLGSSAADLAMTPHAQWKSIAPNEFTIDYDGARTWPRLKGKLPEMKAGTYAKITWEAKAENEISDNHIQVFYPKCKKNFQVRWTPGKKYERFSIYLFNQADDAPTVQFSMNPGKAEKLSVKNLQFEELSPAALEKNLLPDGDFECNSIPVFFRRESENFDNCYNGGQIVPSPSFLSGKNSLKIQGSADKKTVFTSNRLPAIPGKTAVLKFWAKADENSALRLVMNMEGLMNRSGKHLYKDKTVKVGTEWNEFTFEFAIPTDSTTYPALNDGLLFLHFQWNQSSKAPVLYLDNIEYFLR